MLIKHIISGAVGLGKGEGESQTIALDKAVQNLRNFNTPLTLVLDSGEKICIEKVREGGDCSESALSVTLSK